MFFLLKVYNFRMEKKPQKNIGILGGSGAAATANFFSDLVDTAQKKYGAEQDTEFPRVFLYNAPLEGFNETGFEHPELVKKQLVIDVQKIESWGADFIVMPCNTIHYFIIEMRAAIKIPIISIIESTIQEIQKTPYKKIGLLSSTSTRVLKLYENALQEAGFEPILTTESEQKNLDAIILAVMAGKQGDTEVAMMKSAIERMKAEGAEAVILGCTELPLAITQTDTDVPLFNTIHLLVETALESTYKNTSEN